MPQVTGEVAPLHRAHAEAAQLEGVFELAQELLECRGGGLVEGRSAMEPALEAVARLDARVEALDGSLDEAQVRQHVPRRLGELEPRRLVGDVAEEREGLGDGRLQGAERGAGPFVGGALDEL